MNILSTAAVIAAMLTGPFPVAGVTSRNLNAPGENAAPRVAQIEREVTPAPLPQATESSQRIAAFWIILSN